MKQPPEKMFVMEISDSELQDLLQKARSEGKKEGVKLGYQLTRLSARMLQCSDHRHRGFRDHDDSCINPQGLEASKILRSHGAY